MTTQATTATYPSAARAWYAVGILYLAYTLSFVDRQILAFLVGPIRSDLKLTDFQFSLIHGLAFVLFYSTFGIPIARLADRFNRRNIVAVGIVFWSAMTAACGLANNYWQLFLARLGVGVGEATLSPAAVSIIADNFPKEKRALPISMYSAGIHGGAAMANIFGGLVVGYAMSATAMSLPLLGELRPWQVALILVGLPGPIIALLMLTVREPVRHEQTAAQHTLSFREVLAYLNRHRLVYGSLMIGASFTAMASYGTFSWVPALFDRRFAWGPARIGLHMGIITLVVGTGGLFLGGMIAEKMVRAGRAAAYSKAMVACMASAAVPAALLVAVANPYWTLGCLALLVALLSVPIGLAQAAIQAITPNQMRAQMIAVYLLVVALIGNASGPSAVAAVTDYYFHNDAAVGSSMAIVCSAAALLGAAILLAGLNAYKRVEQRPVAS